MAKPTENDWSSFRSESKDSKIAVLYDYVCCGVGNMQRVAQTALRSDNAQDSRRVSCIMRCFGFEGNNCGTLIDLDITKDDVAAFVKKYPNGCEYGKGAVIMRNYMTHRINSRSKKPAAGTEINNEEKVESKASNTDDIVTEQEHKDAIVVLFAIVMILGIIILTLVVHLKFLESVFISALIAGVLVLACELASKRGSKK